ncbi:methyltransferase [Flammeovirgaceae bacterium SG7u.111]|nr:methyltransferase [Flammeovirgaceae bacterium SG7u.132]WPO36152.1 methyltransferase [Flammeovirgaceae bacterium SG7u.111]
MSKELSIIEAKYEAQKLAFGPIYFQAVITMRELGIMELISKKRKGITPEEITKVLDVSLYGVEVLIEAAANAGVVEVLENGAVILTKVGVMLNSDELTKVNLNFVNDVCYDAAKFTTESIKKGKPEGLKVFGEWPTVYEGLSQLPPKVQKSWFEFDHFYSDGAFGTALKIVFKEKPKLLFDLGGNTGKWAMECCAFDEGVNIKILDLAGQLNVAKENIKKRGFENRISFHQINLLDTSQQVPAGADAVWMSQFLDCFSEEEIVAILQNVHAAIDENAYVYILEPFINNQDYPAAAYSLTGTSLYFTSVANGNSKMYTEERMLELTEKAGLKLVESYPLIGHSYHTILKLQKA